jgi:hypothetical protein
MSRIKIKSRKVKTRRIKLAITDLPQVADAFFIGDPNRPGWICMAVNDKGRECVDALFPQAKIAWRDAGDIVPTDWHGFDINLPDVVATMETKLPLDITDGANLDSCTPDALAFLLAIGVKRQGGRGAIYSSKRGLEIYHGTSSHN